MINAWVISAVIQIVGLSHKIWSQAIPSKPLSFCGKLSLKSFDIVFSFDPVHSLTHPFFVFLLDKLKVTHKRLRTVSCEIRCFIVIAFRSGISFAGGSESVLRSGLFVYCSAPFLTWSKDQQTSERFTAHSYSPQNSVFTHKTLQTSHP